MEINDPLLGVTMNKKEKKLVLNSGCCCCYYTIRMMRTMMTVINTKAPTLQAELWMKPRNLGGEKRALNCTHFSQHWCLLNTPTPGKPLSERQVS